MKPCFAAIPRSTGTVSDKAKWSRSLLFVPLCHQTFRCLPLYNSRNIIGRPSCHLTVVMIPSLRRILSCLKLIFRRLHHRYKHCQLLQNIASSLAVVRSTWSPISPPAPPPSTQSAPSVLLLHLWQHDLPVFPNLRKTLPYPSFSFNHHEQHRDCQ